MKFLIYYFLFLFFLLSIFTSGVLDSIDSLQYLAVARNIYYKGKPTAPLYEYNTRKNLHLKVFVGKDGNTYSTTGLGFSAVMVPAVALTDIFYKYYNITPVERFPLENDWLILLTASFINNFFGALMGVILYVYLLRLKITHNQALFISFVGIFATNLFAYSKHTWPHMMFNVFMVLSFLMIKLFADTKKIRYLVFSGISFGIMSISYYLTFALVIIPFLVYYFYLLKPKINLLLLKTLLKHGVIFFIGVLPFIFIFFWFENLRAYKVDQTLTSPAFVTSTIGGQMIQVPPGVFFEAVYGQLFSPGRSLFIYSPILLLIIFFWYKIKKNVFPELIVFLLLTGIFIFFYALQHSYDPSNGYTGLWHGESSWGPRYLTVILPFAVLIIGSIYSKLQSKAKLLVCYPLLLVGLYIQLLGIIMPYQLKYHDLERSFKINGTEFTNYTYHDLIPRFSPIFMMSKKLVKNLIAYPKTLDHGEYNVKYYDGIDFPFNVGKERWRTIEEKGYISFDNSKKDPIKTMSFGLINHPLRVSSSSAMLSFKLNGQPLLEKSAEFLATERKIIDLPIKKQFLKDKGNQLEVEVIFDPPLKEETPQIFAIIAHSINEKAVNLESLDFPYYSPLGPAMVNAKYNTYGGKITDPWRFWEIHTQIYERTPDFWWMRTWYYWDYPKKVLNIIFAFTLLATILFGFKIFRGGINPHSLSVF